MLFGFCREFLVLKTGDRQETGNPEKMQPSKTDFIVRDDKVHNLLSDLNNPHSWRP